MAATCRSSNVTTGAVSITPVGKPTGTVNADLMIAFLCQQSSVAPTPPAGWTLINNTTSGSFGVWWYSAPGSTATGTWTVNANSQLFLISVQGGGTLSVDNSAGQANASSVSCTAPNPSGSVGGCLLCCFSWNNSLESSITLDAALSTATSNPTQPPAASTGFQNSAGSSPGTRISTVSPTAAVNVGVSVLVKDSVSIDQETDSAFMTADQTQFRQQQANPSPAITADNEELPGSAVKNFAAEEEGIVVHTVTNW